MTCVFCDIVNEDAPAEVVHKWVEDPVWGVEDPVWCGVWAIKPLNPVVEGHVLLIPTNHVSDASISPVTSANVMACASEYVSWLDSDANIITSIGSAATQTVKHLHLHVVPRKLNDGLLLPWNGREKLNELRTQIHDDIERGCKIHEEYGHILSQTR